MSTYKWTKRDNMKFNFSDEIMERVKMADVVERYHRVGRRNRTSCPFHNGKDNNLCYDGVVYHCWVCGAKGNVITFVMNYFGIDYRTAIAKINEDFKLGLPVDGRMTLRQRKELRERDAERRKKREVEEREKREWEELKDRLFGEYVRLDRNLTDYAPKSPEEDFHPLYVEAVNNIDYAKYLIEKYL